MSRHSENSENKFSKFLRDRSFRESIAKSPNIFQVIAPKIILEHDIENCRTNNIFSRVTHTYTHFVFFLFLLKWLLENIRSRGTSFRYMAAIDVKIKANLKNNTGTIKLKRYVLITTFNTFRERKKKNTLQLSLIS